MEYSIAFITFSKCRKMFLQSVDFPLLNKNNFI